MIIKRRLHSWLTLAMSNKCINNITSTKHSWPDYGAKIKDDPTCDTVPITPNWAPLLIIGKGNVVSLRVFVELPRELTRVSWSGIIGTCICLAVFVSHEDSAISHPRNQDY